MCRPGQRRVQAHAATAHIDAGTAVNAPRPVRLTILDLMDDQVFGPWFRGPSWCAWRVFLKVLFGLMLNPAELETYAKHTGRQHPPTEQASEAWLVVGRRGGKSLIAALVAVFLACFRDYSK